MEMADGIVAFPNVDATLPARPAERPGARAATDFAPVIGEAAPLDDLRQLAVVVWSRAKLAERLVGAQSAVDDRILVSLAEIDAAVTAIRARLDALEDALPRRAA